MNFTLPSLGVVSLYILTGFFASVIFILLALSARTPFYAQIISTVEKSPIVSLIVTIPFMMLLGVFTDALRFLLAGLILKRSVYCFDALLPPLKSLAVRAISETLQIKPEEVQLDFDLQFLSTRQILLPDFDEYKSHDRWLHDLFQNNIVISVFAFLVVAARWLAFPVGSFDWAIIIICGIGAYVFLLRLKSLKRSYTLHEVNLVIHQSRQVNVPVSTG